MLVCVGLEYKGKLEQFLEMCKSKKYDRNEVYSKFDSEEQKVYVLVLTKRKLSLQVAGVGGDAKYAFVRGRPSSHKGDW
jgi:hypothetical protein